MVLYHLLAKLCLGVNGPDPNVCGVPLLQVEKSGGLVGVPASVECLEVVEKEMFQLGTVGVALIVAVAEVAAVVLE